MTGKILIAYYSHSANTRRLANMICQKTVGDLWEIQPKESYPIEYHKVVKQAEEEITAGYRPEIRNMPNDLSEYDMLIVGTPNWWGSAAPPVLTFLENSDWCGKIILPFCTHGGSGLSNIVRHMKKCCRGAYIKAGFCAYGGTASPKDVSKWLKKNGAIK